MDIEAEDVTVFVYTAGVMVSGLWVGSPEPAITPGVATIGVIAAVGWTAYFNWRVKPQFRDDDEPDDGDPDAERPEDGDLDPESPENGDPDVESRDDGDGHAGEEPAG
jgi:hypothetical protein